MTRLQEKTVARGLWSLYGILALLGLAMLAQALLLPRPSRAFPLKLPPLEALVELRPVAGARDGLIEKRFTRRVAAAPAGAGALKPQELPLDQMLKLTGLLDFGDKQPALAVIEAGGESKAYKAGDKIGETGAVVKSIKESVIVDFNQRRFKLTFAGAQELPANSVGKD